MSARSTEDAKRSRTACLPASGATPHRSSYAATGAGWKKGPSTFLICDTCTRIRTRTLQGVWGKETEWITGEAPLKLNQRRKKLRLAM